MDDLIAELRWVADTFADLDESQHHDRGAGPYDAADVVRARAAIDKAVALLGQPRPDVPTRYDLGPLIEKQGLGAGIVAWMAACGRRVLFSEVADVFGRWNPTHNAFTDLQREGKIRAVFPDAKPGDSGLQYWEVVK